MHGIAIKVRKTATAFLFWVLLAAHGDFELIVSVFDGQSIIADFDKSVGINLDVVRICIPFKHKKYAKRTVTIVNNNAGHVIFPKGTCHLFSFDHFREKFNLTFAALDGNRPVKQHFTRIYRAL